MREVFGVLVIAVGVQHYIAPYNFFCVGQVVNTGQVYKGLRRAAGRKFFNKKWNRQSIEFDEYRFLGVDFLSVYLVFFRLSGSPSFWIILQRTSFYSR